MPSTPGCTTSSSVACRATDVPERGTLVALAGEAVPGKPSAAPKLQLLSPMEIERQTAYEGPTWIDQAMLAKWRPDPDVAGFGAELRGRLRSPATLARGSGSWSRRPMVATMPFQKPT